MGIWCWCCNNNHASRRTSKIYMNRLLYAMFLQVSEFGREDEIQVPIVLERKNEREYWLLRKALKKEDSNYFMRKVSVKVVYLALKNYLEELPTPMLVNKLSDHSWWVGLADDLVLTFVFRSAHTPSLMKPLYADKIKRKLRSLQSAKFVLTMCMISMLRCLTWNEKYRRFKSELLTDIIDDLRNTFLIVPKNQFLPELDTVIIVVKFMVQNAIQIFGAEIDSCLIGIQRPQISAPTIPTPMEEPVKASTASTLSTPPSTPISEFKPRYDPNSDSALDRQRSQRATI